MVHFLIILFLLTSSAGIYTHPTLFEGERAYSHIVKQESMGPRIPESEGQEKFLNWAEKFLRDNHWDVRRQPFEEYYQLKDTDLDMTNLIATILPVEPEQSFILLGTHFDTRAFADEDADTPHLPVPGANDGASGVGVLLEAARILKNHYTIKNNYNIVLALFDGEDGGVEPEYYARGSRYFAQNDPLMPHIEWAVILDMVGQADLQLYKEKISLASASPLVHSFWEEGRRLYPETFRSGSQHAIYDDHVPLIEKGIPAFLVIDFNYPYWHTTEDTADKCCADSLQKVGDTLLVFLEKHHIIERRNND